MFCRDERLQAVCYGSGVIKQRLPGNYTREYNGHAYVQDGADDESRDDADRQIPLWVARLFRRSGDGIEAYVSEKNNGATRENSKPAHGSERVPVPWIDVMRCGDNEG